jgi:hypothetical protein
MPKRTGAKKGHQCSTGIDKYCPDCWEKKLKRMGLTEDAGARRDKLSLVPQLLMASFADQKEAPRRGYEEPLDPEDYHTDDHYIAPRRTIRVHQKIKRD